MANEHARISKLELEQWTGTLLQMTSQKEGWDRGYQQALAGLFDAPKARKMEHTEDYQGVRQALDAAPDILYMTRFTVMFYLGMSPAVFKKAMQRGSHPFGDFQAGATKGEVDAWFSRLLAAKHVEAMPHVRPLRVSRDLDSGRPYLVDITGTILADGAISNINPQDVAYAASLGAGIRVLSLSEALGMPWRDPLERKTWAGFRQRVLQENIDAAQEALRLARAQDLEASFEPQAPPNQGRGSL